MTEQKVSYRYARALFENAREAGLVEQVYKDFKQVAEVMEESKELYALTKNPVFQQWRKKKIYQEIFTTYKVSELTLSFLILLIDKRRGELIPSVIKQYEIIYHEFNKLLPVKVYSAVELPDDTQERIIDALDTKTGMQVLPEFIIDESIKGGIVVRIRDWVYDASIKNKLKALRKELAEGIPVEIE